MALEHLGKNAACAPHINGWSVLAKLKQELWRAVPASDDQSGVVTHGNSISLTGLGSGTVVMSCQTKIGNLQNTTVANEDVGG